MKMIVGMCAFFVLFAATTALSTGPAGVKGEVHNQPKAGDAFRSQASLRFMRRIHSAHQEPEKHNAGSAQKASGKVANQQEPEADSSKKAPAKVPPLQQAVEAVTDGINDAVADAQQGPNADSKDAQKVAEQVAKESKKQAPANAPNEKTGTAATKGAGDALEGPTYTVKEQEAEEKGVPSVPGCKNSPKGWTDAKGNDCEDYAEGEWCTRRGGYADGWMDEWGTFENVTNKGHTAKEVCCVCGGGFQKDDGLAGSPAPAIAGPILGTKKGRMLQGQGYSGELVVHEDRKTMTEDWGREFGPHAGHRDIKTICQEHPGNEWCSLHGYFDKRSGTPLKSVVAIFAALLLACWP